jgi:hypothetical protein
LIGWSDLTFLPRRVAWVVIFLSAIVILTMVFKAAPPPTIREITPAERKQVAYLEDKFKLHGYLWLVDRKTGEISYWRKGKWRVIKSS